MLLYKIFFNLNVFITFWTKIIILYLSFKIKYKISTSINMVLVFKIFITILFITFITSYHYIISSSLIDFFMFFFNLYPNNKNIIEKELKINKL